MSYRTFKRLLGETSLERKCRFLFGGGLMLLISGSFYFYAWSNSDLVYDQNKKTARLLVSPILITKHWKYYETNKDFEPVIEQFARSLKPEDIEEYSWTLLNANPAAAESTDRPMDDAGYDALEQLRQGRNEVVKIHSEKKEYQYYGAVKAARSCVDCHNLNHPQQDLQQGDLMGMAKITFPLEPTQKALAWNNAILLTTAIVTTFLAMLAAYAIVRYVIVKPVLHLKHVSDEITRGNLDLRADIHTGDEFEELSHAFNRMLRHMVTVQEELRQVNSDLDAKVDELAQVNLRLYEMNKLKDEFLATMSHELRTPLNSILGFSDVLAGAGNLNEKQKRFVANIQESGKNLMALINDVLDLAKIESGKFSLQITHFSIGEVIEQQVGSLRPMAAQKNIDLTWDVAEDMPALQQDALKIQQILNNLLSNAIKFTPEGGRVRVGAALAVDGMWDLIVEDTGIGIPLEDQDAIFEKFRQAKSIPGQQDALTREYGGTGLGLSIIKELAKLLGGEVFLESEFGKGSTFTVRLPVCCEETDNLRPGEDLAAGIDVARRQPAHQSPAAGHETASSPNGGSDSDESAA